MFQRISVEFEFIAPAWNIYSDGGLAVHGALVFANSAADAPLPDDVWLLNGHYITIRGHQRLTFQLYSLVRNRAHLFAYDAISIVSPGDASVLVNVRQSHYFVLFLGQSEFWYCSSRTYLATGVAGVDAIPQSRYQHWGPETLQTGFLDSGLETASRAGAHTFTTTDAF